MLPSMLLFLDISAGELAVIALVIFIVLGPDKIPDLARKFGKAMRYVRKATEDIKREINIDENLIQKPRAYSYTKKSTPTESTLEAKEAQPDKDDQVEEPEDNKSAN